MVTYIREEVRCNAVILRRVYSYVAVATPREASQRASAYGRERIVVATHLTLPQQWADRKNFAIVIQTS